MPSVFEKNSKKTIFIVIVLLLVIIDFSLSIIYTKIKGNRERVGLGIPNQIYHHDFIRNGYSAESGRLGEYELYTNSLGFKDKSNRKIARNIENRRILFIGDSFTEGVLLNYQDTFVGIIDSAATSKNIEVLNAGRASYSPIIYWRKVKYLIEDIKLKFDELIVFIDISDMDDEASYYDLSDDNNVIDKIVEPIVKSRDYGISWFISNQSIENIRLFLRNNFIIMSSGINWIHDILFHDSLELQRANNESVNNLENVEIDTLTSVKVYNTWDRVLADRRANWTVDDKYYQEYAVRGKKRMKKYMDKLVQLTNENGIELTVVVYPWPSQIWYEDLNSLHVQIWEEWCNKNNVKFINLFPSFVKVNISDIQKLDIISKYFVPYDLHLNQEGNKVIADELLKQYFNIYN